MANTLTFFVLSGIIWHQCAQLFEEGHWRCEGVPAIATKEARRRCTTSSSTRASGKDLSRTVKIIILFCKYLPKLM
jgi:hypothetical protein